MKRRRMVSSPDAPMTTMKMALPAIPPCHNSATSVYDPSLMAAA